MSSSTQPLRRVPFQQVTPNLPRVAAKHDHLVTEVPHFVPTRPTAYTPDQLLAFRKDAVPFFLPKAIRVLFAASPPSQKTKVEETNPQRLAMRTKQIQYGKSSDGYRRYIALVPRDQRVVGDPRTPDISMSCSKRCWDGQVRKWRRALHAFDLADTLDLAAIRRQLAVINATPNKMKVPATDPIVRQTRLPADFSLPRRLSFDDLDTAEC